MSILLRSPCDKERVLSCCDYQHDHIMPPGSVSTSHLSSKVDHHLMMCPSVPQAGHGWHDPQCLVEPLVLTTACGALAIVVEKRGLNFTCGTAGLHVYTNSLRSLQCHWRQLATYRMIVSVQSPSASCRNHPKQSQVRLGPGVPY